MSRTWLEDATGKKLEWLKALNGRYRKNARLAIEKFETFTGKTCDQILEERKTDHKLDDEELKHRYEKVVVQFHNWLQTEYISRNTGKPLSSASARSVVAPIRGFFSYYRYPIMLRKGELGARTPSLGDHKLTIEQIRKMYHVGDGKERALLSCGKDLMLRVGDFVRLKRAPILEQIDTSIHAKIEYPIEFDIMTKKEKTPCRCHLMRESIEDLRRYWETVPNSKFVFVDFKGNHLKEDYMNDMLRSLWRKAFRDPKLEKLYDKTLRWHCLRKLGESSLSNAGIQNIYRVNLMVGKKIPDDQWVYLQQMNLKPDFEKVESLISIHGRTNAELSEIDAIKKHVDEQDKIIGLFANVLKNNKEFMATLAQAVKEGTLSAEMLWKKLRIKVDERD
jgi:hypothetical protein